MLRAAETQVPLQDHSFQTPCIKSWSRSGHGMLINRSDLEMIGGNESAATGFKTGPVQVFSFLISINSARAA